MTLSFCTTTKNAALSSGTNAKYSYAEDVAPLIGKYCSPCHFPDDGNLKFLDTHKAVARNIDDIIYRVDLSPGQDNFMPAGADIGLSNTEIQLLKDWRDSGMN